jgi:hypothetical protein
VSAGNATATVSVHQCGCVRKNPDCLRLSYAPVYDQVLADNPVSDEINAVYELVMERPRPRRLEDSVQTGTSDAGMLQDIDQGIGFPGYCKPVITYRSSSAFRQHV